MGVFRFATNFSLKSFLYILVTPNIKYIVDNFMNTSKHATPIFLFHLNQAKIAWVIVVCQRSLCISGQFIIVDNNNFKS